MQRHEMMAALTGLGLKGMAGAFDEAVTTGLQRKRTTMEILADLLRAETTHRHAASIRYRMAAAKLPAVKDLDAFVFDDTPINEGLVRSLHSGAFLANRRNIVLVGGTGTGKTHLATAIITNVVRADPRPQMFEIRLRIGLLKPIRAQGLMGAGDPVPIVADQEGGTLGLEQIDGSDVAVQTAGEEADVLGSIKRKRHGRRRETFQAGGPGAEP